MATYVCAEIIENTCKTWVENTNLLDTLAITPAQAVEISLSIAGVWITAFIIGELGHMIKVNFERRF